jgi:exonuclease SbcD
MAISLIHVSDIHFGSGESHGRLNPESGLNVRLEDFVGAFEKSVTYAIDSQVDIFLFSGDAYRNASPEPIYQKLFAKQLKRLSDAGIKTVLLVGNHDQILRSTGSHSMSVFQSLAVPHLLTIDEPGLTRIDTKNGTLQLVGVPHVTRHILMTHEKYADMTARDIDKMLVMRVNELLQHYYDELDPALPTVATAHMMIEQSRAGCEQELMIGYTLAFPLDMFIDPRLDYVALGHVHRHQVLRSESPAIVYAGSLERVDFGEADEDKGFLHVLIERGKTKYAFHSIQPRPFITVEVDVSKSDQPAEDLAKQIARQVVDGCVLRVIYKARKEQIELIDEQALKQASAAALSATFRAEVVGVQRDFRLPQITESSIATPLTALDVYLENMAPDRKEQLMEKAKHLAAKLAETGT